tara:strand:- start:566 stop:817 length:252 start_codon:yes stop_codon:yes gene_type:complete
MTPKTSVMVVLPLGCLFLSLVVFVVFRHGTCSDTEETADQRHDDHDCFIPFIKIIESRLSVLYAFGVLAQTVIGINPKDHQPK